VRQPVPSSPQIASADHDRDLDLLITDLLDLGGYVIRLFRINAEPLWPSKRLAAELEQNTLILCGHWHLHADADIGPISSSAR
jgi:hypothetical protein